MRRTTGKYLLDIKQFIQPPSKKKGGAIRPPLFQGWWFVCISGKSLPVAVNRYGFAADVIVPFASTE